MTSKSKKTAGPRPFKVLSRKAAGGWLIGMVVVSGWMFALGVLVGRDQAPIEFDVNALEKKIAQLKHTEARPKSGGPGKKTGLPKDKTQLDFYEALPEDREDTKIPERPKSEPVAKKIHALESSGKPPQGVGGAKRPEGKTAPAAASGAPARTRDAGAEYTIQAASMKKRPDADRLVSKLKTSGYPAFRLTSEVEGKGTWHRVRIGPYASKAEARRVLDELRRVGMKPILVLKK